MKKNTHPKYQKVLFVDSTTGQRFIIGSTLQPKETEKFEGKEYPVYQLSTSSYSHPFFTGSNKFVDAEGRVDRFKNRYINAQKRGQEIANPTPAAPVEEKKATAAKKKK